MGVNRFNKIFKKIPWMMLLIILTFSVAFAYLIACVGKTIQEVPETTISVGFYGEYRIGDGEWQHITGEHIPSTKGDVTLRGRFRLCDPLTKHTRGALKRGDQIAFHLSHISCTVYAPGRDPYVFPCELVEDDELGCGNIILPYEYSSAASDTITIVLSNSHEFGNDNAVDHFLEALDLYSGVEFETRMIRQGDLQRTIGYVALTSGVLILGAAVLSSLIHDKGGRRICFAALMMMFGAGELIFSAPGVSLWNGIVVLNTVANGICMMFYVIMLLCYIGEMTRGLCRSMTNILVVFFSVATLAVLLASILPNVRFYDMYGIWFGLFLLASFPLLVCLAENVRSCDRSERGMIILASLAVVGIDVDVIAIAMGLWNGGRASRFVFVAIYLASLITILHIIPSRINLTFHAQRLEAEQKKLELELQDSRIAIMLSQIQPHFMFNVLNTIYYLCEKDPKTARYAISRFSDYLRNNLENIAETDLVSFAEELEHVTTYMDLEKIRFGDELEVVYDVTVADFKIPVLTVQPLMENAVKHGTSRKRGGGRVTLSTRETDENYIITIADTGRGFDPSKISMDGKDHVGIFNVRNRLALRCGGTLEIDSVPGEGTTAVVTIPKGELAYENIGD